jgi:hypothetical protein
MKTQLEKAIETQLERAVGTQLERSVERIRQQKKLAESSWLRFWWFWPLLELPWR